MSSSKHNKDKLPFGADKSGLRLVRKKSKGKDDREKGKERRKSVSKGLGIKNPIAAAMLHTVGAKGHGQFYVEKVKEDKRGRGSSLSDSLDRLAIEDNHDWRRSHRRDSYNSSQGLLYEVTYSAQSYGSRDERDYYDNDGFDPHGYDPLEYDTPYLEEGQPSGKSSHHSPYYSFQDHAGPAYDPSEDDNGTTTSGTSTLYHRTHGVASEYEESTHSSHRTARPPSGQRDKEKEFYTPPHSIQSKSPASTVRPQGRHTSGFRTPSPDRPPSRSHAHKERHSRHESYDPKKTKLPRGPKAEVTEADDRESLASRASTKASTAAEYSLPPMDTSRHSKTGGSSSKHERPHSSASHSRHHEPPRGSKSSTKEQREPSLSKGPKPEVTEADDRESLQSTKSSNSTAYEFSMPPMDTSRHSGTGSKSRQPPQQESRDHRRPTTDYYYPPSTHADTRASRESRDSRPPAGMAGYYPASTATGTRDARDSRDYRAPAPGPGQQYYNYPSSSNYSASETSTNRTTTTTDSASRPNPFDFQVPSYGPTDSEIYGPTESEIYGPPYYASHPSSRRSNDGGFSDGSDDTIRGADPRRASGRRAEGKPSRSSKATGKGKEDLPRYPNLYRP